MLNELLLFNNPPVRARDARTVMPIMTTVSSWRCKCGTRIKVVGERDRTQEPNRIPAACPKCGDKQVIYTDRILSVEEDTSTHILEK